MKSYNQFKVESSSRAATVKFDEKGILEALCESEILNDDEQFIVKFSLTEGLHGVFFQETVNESLIDTWKRKFDTAVETAKEKGKAALSKSQEIVMKIGQNIKGLLMLIIEAVKKILKEIWTRASAAAKAGVDAVLDDIEQAVFATEKDNVASRTEESKNALQMVGAGAAFVKTKFVSSIAAAEKKAVQESAQIFELYVNGIQQSLLECIREGVASREYLLSDINFSLLEKEGSGEGQVPFLSTVIKRISTYPPFNKIEGIYKSAEKFATNALEKTSSILSQVADAPGPFKFPWLGSMVTKVSLKSIDPSLGSPTKFVEGVARKGITALIAASLPGLALVMAIARTCLKIYYIVMAALTVFEKVIKDLGEEAPEFAKKIASSFRDALDYAKSLRKKDDEEKEPEKDKEKQAKESLLNFEKWILTEKIQPNK
jgi:hypothetical protein